MIICDAFMTCPWHVHELLMIVLVLFMTCSLQDHNFLILSSWLGNTFYLNKCKFCTQVDKQTDKLSFVSTFITFWALYRIESLCVVPHGHQGNIGTIGNIHNKGKIGKQGIKNMYGNKGKFKMFMDINKDNMEKMF